MHSIYHFLFQSLPFYLHLPLLRSSWCVMSPAEKQNLRRNKIINFMHVSSLAVVCYDICFVSSARVSLSAEIETKKLQHCIFSSLCHQINGNRPIHILIYRLHGRIRILRGETCTSYAEFIQNANCVEMG